MLDAGIWGTDYVQVLSLAEDLQSLMAINQNLHFECKHPYPHGNLRGPPPNATCGLEIRPYVRQGSWWDIIPETFFFGPLFFLVGFFLVALGGPYAPKKNPMIVESPAIGIEGGY